MPTSMAEVIKIIKTFIFRKSATKAHCVGDLEIIGIFRGILNGNHAASSVVAMMQEGAQEDPESSHPGCLK